MGNFKCKQLPVSTVKERVCARACAGDRVMNSVGGDFNFSGQGLFCKENRQREPCLMRVPADAT